jgi:Mg-chelatase subunit ChlD/lysophospholipase L1-like esterase
MNVKARVLIGRVLKASVALLLCQSAGAALVPGEALPPFKIVHVGDSYSAGNGARAPDGGKNYNGVKGCYRSPTNWGNRFVDSLSDVFSVTYVNRACSGAVIANILDTPQAEVEEIPAFVVVGGSVVPIPCPEPEYPDQEEWECNVGGKHKKSVTAQINSIDESVDLVVLTIGGNDLGFASIVKQCFATGLRDAPSCEKAVDFANEVLDEEMPERLRDLFAKLRDELREDARVAYVAYPHLVPDVEYGLRWFGIGPAYPVSDEIRALADRGDEVQREAIATANAAAGEEWLVFYDGTKELFEGHLPNPFQSEPRNLDRWIHEFDTFTKMEWYHYNALGHENLGLALAPFETFGAAGGIFELKNDIDIAFVVDTTGSMGGEIAEVRSEISNLVAQLALKTTSYRVAVVSYRDFSERTGWSGDYPARVDQDFTENMAAIQAAIDGLSADGGGDYPETIFSGIDVANKLSWRPGVTKIAVVIGDAPALVGGTPPTEPISGLTASQIVADSIAIDPVQVVGLDVGSLNGNGALGEIADGTGGTVIRTGQLTETISELLDETSKKPYAWIGQAYAGKIGEPIEFDASGSYDPSGEPLFAYEWDFNADGIFEVETVEPTIEHTYSTVFEDYVVARVSGPGGTALASARVVVNEQGFVSQGDEEPCEIDENGVSVIVDEEGQWIRCTPDSLPTEDKPGVEEVDLSNQPPECGAAEPSEELLWSPNHRWVTVDILGVTDPDGDPITIYIDSIFQDEALDAKGSGNTAPDGKGLGETTAEIRAERAGKGDGRVYHIGFTATDVEGAACTGEVTVGVPLNQGKASTPVDGGAIYDSTQSP